MTSQRIVLPNLSDRTILEAEAIFRMLAHLSEESIFLILGMSVFQIFNRVDVSASFIGWTFLACLIGRAVQVSEPRAKRNLNYKRLTHSIMPLAPSSLGAGADLWLLVYLQ